MKKIKISGNYQYRALTEGFVVQRFWHANKFNLLNSIANFSPQDVVLDAGCGSGNISFYLAKKVKRVVGLDINQEAINFAQKYAQKNKFKNLSFRRADLRKTPYKKDSFDKIILFEVVEHLNFKNYQKVIAEMYRLLKLGGYLYLTTPNEISIWFLIEWILDTFKLTPPLRNNQHILTFSISSLEKVLKRNRFKIKDKGTMNHLSPFVSLFSWSLANKISLLEIKYLKKLGPIIWIAAQK